MATAENLMSLFEREYAQARAQLAAGSADRIAAAQSLAASTGAARHWLNLAFELFSAYRFGEAHAALDDALRLETRLLPARWLQFQFPEAPAPLDDAQADAFRARWQSGVSFFEQLDYGDPRVRQQVWGCVGAAPAFYRHYLDEDCVSEQRRFGALVHRMMSSLDPGLPSRPMRRGRRRVLFVSPYLYRHTVARLFLPLVERLDPSRLDVHLVQLGPERDEMTARASRAGSFHHAITGAPQLRSAIGAIAPDVIVYLDLGMHPSTLALAALRLAPVQATLWGHPVTTGLPTLDHFLSPDAMEAGGAEAHYTENLVRLPGLGHGLDVDAAHSPPPVVAGDEMHADRPIDFLCAQSVYKLLPAQDALFARVLAALPGSRLHMAPHPLAHVREWLRQRMSPALAAHGVDPGRVVMHGYGPLAEFLTLADRCDVNLDSLGWSGGMSSIDLLRRGLPTVTMDGTFMRSRQTAALLRHAGLPELVVRSGDEWVELAIALARSGMRRDSIRARLRDAAPAFSDPQRVAAALQDFLVTCRPRG
jgi:protein O-GlcNAc transferase